MEHRDARALASRSLDADLTDTEEKDLAVHLVSCGECKTFYDGLTRARTAISRLGQDGPSETAVDGAVWRATTVLAGDADPGPLEGHEDTGSFHVDDLPTDDAWSAAETEPVEATASGIEPDLEGTPGAETEAEPAVTTVFDDAVTTAEPEGVVGPGPLAPDHPEDLSPPVQAPQPHETSTHPRLDDLEVPETVTIPAPRVPQTSEEHDPTADVPWPAPVEAADGPEFIDDPAVDLEPGPAEPRLRPRIGPLVVGLAVTIGIVALVLSLVLQGSPLGNGVDTADLPDGAQIRQGVAGAFDELETLRTSFRITRLGLYRLGVEDGTITYSFSNGLHRGDLVYETPDRIREERLIELPEYPSRRVTVARGEELRMLTRSPDGDTYTIIENPPFGPPDVEYHAPLGSLEYAIGSAAKLLTTSDDVSVLERTAVGDREAYRIRFGVRPSPFTRADRIDMLVDSASFFPLTVIRSLDRVEAEVLGPPDVLNDEAIERAFGDRERIVTERVELTDTIVNDVVLPGRFTLEEPGDLEVDEQDAEFVPATEIDDLSEELDFDPLTPASIPRGYRERGSVVFTGDTEDWGPDEEYPAPEGILQSLYSDGMTSIVLSQRMIDDGPFDIEGSPLVEPGLPVTTRTEVRGGHEFTYAISPEAPPHVFGFIDDVFVMAVGYAPQEDLVRLAASLSEGVPQTPEASPSRLRTPVPTPDGTPD